VVEKANSGRQLYRFLIFLTHVNFPRRNSFKLRHRVLATNPDPGSIMQLRLNYSIVRGSCYSSSLQGYSIQGLGILSQGLLPAGCFQLQLSR
jgi:hypothetical protein